MDFKSLTIGGAMVKDVVVILEKELQFIANGDQEGDLIVETELGKSQEVNFKFHSGIKILPAGPTTFAAGGQVSLVANILKQDNYIWKKGGIIIPNASSFNYLATESGLYSYEIEAGGTKYNSKPIEVRVIYTLPTSNFKLSVNSESCKTSNNGTIHIIATKKLNYTATVTGKAGSQVLKFTDTLIVSSLSADKYSVCITFEGESEYKQCFDAVITEPKDLTAFTSVNNKDKNVSIDLSGGSVYHVELNGQVMNTTESKITLPLANGNNNLKITSDKICQGVIEKNINLAEDVLIYPNPFNDILNLSIENAGTGKTRVRVHSLESKLVFFKEYLPNENPLSLDLTHLTTGIYLLEVSINNSTNIHKIVKK